MPIARKYGIDKSKKRLLNSYLYLENNMGINLDTCYNTFTALIVKEKT